MTVKIVRRIVIAAITMLAAKPAFAHHVMGGEIPTTFFEGFLSGLGHPVIGPDHFAFIAAIGIVTGLCGLNLALPAAYITTMAVGIALHVSGVALPANEIPIAASLLLAGFLLARGRSITTLAWFALFAAAGLFHGMAFGETIYGAEPTPLAAYLFGLIAIQSALAIGIAFIVRLKNPSANLATRFAGVAIFGVGFMALIAQLIRTTPT